MSARDLGPAALVALVCAAQVLAQLGAFFWPALLPRMMPLWSLSNSQAGWITAAFYAAYMVSVPVLVTLTDRIDAKRVYLFGVGSMIAGHLYFSLLADGFWSATAARAVTGLGWAGTYMTGLKLLADRVDEKLMSRAVTGHAASIGISGAFSFLVADLIAQAAGWQVAFLAAAVSAAIAWLAVCFFAPRRIEQVSKNRTKTFDFGPVFRNRSAMAYAIAYGVHSLEMNGLRGWVVAFLAFAAASTAVDEPWLSPAATATILGIIGTFASVAGNELAIRHGRRFLVASAMTISLLIASVLGFLGATSYSIAAGLVLVYAFFIWLDSASLTAGAAGSAAPEKRGATLAVHSSLGYAGGFIGPLAIGWTLDLSGGMSAFGWGMAFLVIAVLGLIAVVTFLAMRPAALAGDRESAKRH
jgi:predicted MFS family arabinose efflux permease